MSVLASDSHRADTSIKGVRVACSPPEESEARRRELDAALDEGELAQLPPTSPRGYWVRRA